MSLCTAVTCSRDALNSIAPDETELSQRPPGGTIRGAGKTQHQKARALRERTRARRGHRSRSICMRDNTTLLALNFCRRTVFHPLRKKPQVWVGRYRNSSQRRTAYTAPPTIESIERTRGEATGYGSPTTASASPCFSFKFSFRSPS